MKNWNTPRPLYHFSISMLLGFFISTLFISLPQSGYACEIFEVVVEKGDCTSDSTYSLWINFEYVDVQNDYFDLWANGVYFGYYAYANLPITIPNFPKSGNNNDWIKICDNDNPGCCKIKEFLSKDCSNFNDCSITEVSVVKGDCTSEETYTITINFDYQGVQSDYFDLWFNGVFYDQFLYTALPLTINDFPKSGNNNDWIKICDHENENCCKVKEFDTKDCSNFNGCDLWDLIVEPYACEDGHFLVDLDFNYANVGSNGFTVQGNGVQYGTFDYNDLYITFGPLEGDCQTNYEFVVKDVDNPDCQAVFILGEVCCDSTCNLYDLVVEKGECTSDSTYSLTINFAYQNVNGASFDLYANGTFFGYYNYAQLPLTILNFPKSGGNNDWIKVCDNDNEDCCAIKEFDTKQCGGNGNCEIWDLVIEKGECTSDSTYNLTIDFNYQNVNGPSFDLFANGSFFGSYNYSQLPLTITNFPKSGSNNDWIKVCDNDNENCCKVKEFDTKDCGNNSDCSIKELEANVGDCNEDDLFYVTINFQAMNPGSQGFSILGNGMNYGSFSYDSIPIVLGPFEGDCDKMYEFVVKDNEFENCSKGIDVGKVCCNVEPCEIYDLEVTVGECTGDSTYLVTINFQVQNPGNNYFEVWTNGDYFGYFPLSNLPFTMNFPAGGFNIDELKVCINDHPDCCKTAEFAPPTCLQMPIFTIKASNDTKAGAFESGNNSTLKEGHQSTIGSNLNFEVHVMAGSERLRILTNTGSFVRNIFVFDTMGRQLANFSPSNGDVNQYDVDILPITGIAIIQVTFADGRQVRKVFVP